jgi:hypothetical protein
MYDGGHFWGMHWVWWIPWIFFTPWLPATPPPTKATGFRPQLKNYNYEE